MLLLVPVFIGIRLFIFNTLKFEFSFTEAKEKTEIKEPDKSEKKECNIKETDESKKKISLSTHSLEDSVQLLTSKNEEDNATVTEEMNKTIMATKFKM